MGRITDIMVPFAEGESIKEALLASHRTFPPNTVPNSLRVFIVREPFDDFYTLVLDNGQTEELEDEGVRAWLTERGADETLVNTVVTQAWNFKSAICLIRNPIVPRQTYRPESPKLTLV